LESGVIVKVRFRSSLKYLQHAINSLKLGG